MPKRPGRLPAYRLHKPSGQARVIIAGQHVYLGAFGSSESQEKYARLIAEIVAAPPQTTRQSNRLPVEELSVSDLILRYWRYAETIYTKDGRPTKELACMREALRPLRELYGRSLAREFGPRALKAVQQQLVKDGNCRNVVNHRTSRIKRVFKWAVAEELIPGDVFHALQAVAGLRYGRTEARETEPIKPVPDADVEALLPFLTPTVAAMVQLQRLTGMRPGEVVLMRPRDIDRSGDLWVYEPAEHKTRWRGHHKQVPLGPKAQKVIEPFLDRQDDAYLFSPIEAEAWRRERRPVHLKENRKTPVYPCELRRLEREKQARRKRRRKRPLRERYDTSTYARAIVYALKKAKKAGVEIPHWHPNQLRHSRGTEVRREHGIEAAQVLLGHARADVTQVYAERNFEQACRIAKATG